MKKKGCLLILVLTFSVLLNGCIQVAKPEDTIYKMEEAMNNYDMDMLLECFEPSVQDIYAGVVEIGSSFLGMDIGTLMDAAGGIADLFGDDLIEGGMPSVDIVINSEEQISDEEVLMNLTITMEYAGESEVQTMDTVLVLIDGEWYISADSDLMEYLR